MNHKRNVLPIPRPEPRKPAPRKPLRPVSEKRAASGEPIGLKRTELASVSDRRREERPKAITTLNRSKPLGHASVEQKAKVADRACLVCGEHPCDPAHLIPRDWTTAGQDDALAVVPLCRSHHDGLDREGLRSSSTLSLTTVPSWRLRSNVSGFLRRSVG